MKESTKKYLVDKYNSIPQKTNVTCLKFHYLYNEVNVNVYFDAFDVKSVTLSIVLAAEKQYYYTPLNILNTYNTKEYLNKIPPKILKKISVNKQLDDFYEDMEKHLLKNKPYVNNYNEDIYFVNTIRYTKKRIDYPFWWHVRKAHMTDDTLYKLNARADISIEILREIQQKGFTLVRTADPTKRKEITLILQKEDINFNDFYLG